MKYLKYLCTRILIQYIHIFCIYEHRKGTPTPNAAIALAARRKLYSKHFLRFVSLRPDFLAKTFIIPHKICERKCKFCVKQRQCFGLVFVYFVYIYVICKYKLFGGMFCSRRVVGYANVGVGSRLKHFAEVAQMKVTDSGLERTSKEEG